MGETTGIAWCDATFNPWWGCTKVSQACTRCYAEREAERFGKSGLWGPGRERRLTSDKYWREPVKWNAKAAQDSRRCRVFCGSMMDWSDIEAPAGAVARLWDLIADTPMLDWQLLTKRPERIRTCLPSDWRPEHGSFSRVWLGVSVENQATADRRIPILLTIPAAVHFVSAEPLLELVRLSPYLLQDPQFGIPKLDWVISGGESGPGARACHMEWLRNMRDECNAHGVAYFCKQLGGHPNKRAELDELPPDLRVRQFPATHGG